MISIVFILGKTTEAKAEKVLEEVGIAFVQELGKKVSFAFAPPAVGATFRRIGTVSGEPSLSLLSRGLEHYVWAGATPIDTPPHRIWSFDIQSPNHAIAIPNRNTPTFHILNPDQVSALFQSLAQTLSHLVDVEVSFNDDHTRHGLIFRNGTATKDEYW